MTSKNRARENQRRRHEQLQRKHAARAARRARAWRIGGSLVLAVVGASAVIWLLIAMLGDDDSPADTPSDAATIVPEPAVTAQGWGASAAPPDPARAESRTWTATLATSVGDITVELDGAAAPQAVASFAALAGDGFFDGTDCHRLVTAGIFVLQCGDPEGTGFGGPAYRFGPVENDPADALYPAGTLAMARASGDGESMGSQFFIVYEDSTIPADAAGGYTVFGQVIEGLGIVEDVARAGTTTGEPDGPPAQSVTVNEVSVS